MSLPSKTTDRPLAISLCFSVITTRTFGLSETTETWVVTSGVRISWVTSSSFKKIKKTLSVLWTFILVCFAWIFFRAENLTQAIDFISYLSLDYQFEFIKVIKYILIFLLFEIVVFNFRLFEKANWYFKFGRYSFYTYLLMTIIAHTTNTGSDFIYFQFYSIHFVAILI